MVVLWLRSAILLLLFTPVLLAHTDELALRAYEILKNNCFDCHGVAKVAGLDLRTAKTLFAGGDNGPVIVPRNARESRLYLAITHQHKPTMPPGGKLSAADIETIRQWIEAGASLEYVPEAADADVRNDSLQTIKERPITPEERQWWAFQPLRRTAVPPVTQPGWQVKNPIDAFLLAAMKARGLKPSPKADRRTLIRRAWTCGVCHRRPRKSRHSSRTNPLTPGRNSSTACWRRRTTASGGRGTGWTWCGMPIREALSSTSIVPTCGATATMS